MSVVAVTVVMIHGTVGGENCGYDCGHGKGKR
jgi:hypothetical protein